MRRKHELTSVELFTGAGGLALGISEAGFRHKAVVELDTRACDSLRENKTRVALMRDWPVHEADARTFDFARFSGVDLCAAGTPCQPFSLGGKHRGDDDERNLFPIVLDAVRVIRPKVVLIENVKGLLRSSFSDYLSYVLLRLSNPDLLIRRREQWQDHMSRLSTRLRRSGIADGGYTVGTFLLNAADFGVPQRRERVFIVAWRRDLQIRREDFAPLLARTHSSDMLLFAKWADGSYWRDHHMRDPLKQRARPARESLLEQPPSKWTQNRLRRLRSAATFLTGETRRWRTVRDALKGDDPLPEPSEHADNSMPNHWINPGARAYTGHSGSPWDEPAKTLKAGDHGVPGGENILKLEDGSVRYFTIREAARLQGFPDEYVFQGAWTRAFRQIGNSVPVGLSRIVAQAVAKLL